MRVEHCCIHTALADSSLGKSTKGPLFKLAKMKMWQGDSSLNCPQDDSPARARQFELAQLAQREGEKECAPPTDSVEVLHTSTDHECQISCDFRCSCPLPNVPAFVLIAIAV